MRDVLVHDYFGVDISQIWQVAREDLPALKASIRQFWIQSNRKAS